MTFHEPAENFSHSRPWPESRLQRTRLEYRGGRGGRQGQAPPRASSSSLQIPTKYPGDTIGGSREKFSKLAIDRSLSAINEDMNWMEYFTIHNSPNLSSLFELIPYCVFIDQNEFFEMIPLLIATLNNLELIVRINESTCLSS